MGLGDGINTSIWIDPGVREAQEQETSHTRRGTARFSAQSQLVAGRGPVRGADAQKTASVAQQGVEPAA